MSGNGGGRFRRVIVGVDGRPAARDAIALARLLAAPDGRLVLAHIHAGDLRPSRTASLPFEAIHRDESHLLLESERTASGTDAELASAAAPSVGSGLHQLCEAHDADLLVVGSCARGFGGRVLVGNDTRAALNGAPCAVAVAPLGFAHHPKAIGTIGVGYDGSPESEAALALARSLAARAGAVVQALQVVQMPTSPFARFAASAWNDELEDILQTAHQQLATLNGVQTEAVLGLAGEELAAFGDRVDMLVVGSRGYGPLRRLMFGSTATHLAAHARCPLLVLPRAAVTGRDGEPASGEGPAAAATPD